MPTASRIAGVPRSVLRSVMASPDGWHSTDTPPAKIPRAQFARNQASAPPAACGRVPLRQGAIWGAAAATGWPFCQSGFESLPAPRASMGRSCTLSAPIKFLAGLIKTAPVGIE